MKLDIELYHDNSFLCYERSIATVALWLKRNFEMMFMDVWDFSILVDDKEKRNVGQLIYPGEWNLEKYIKKYHGIQVNNIKFTSNNSLLETIVSEINGNIPVMVDDDWLVTGIDEEKKEVHLFIIHSSQPVIIPWEEFTRGIKGNGIKEYFTFEITGDESTCVDPDYMFEHTKERVCSLESGKPGYEQVKEFAEIFYVAFDYSTELKDAEDVYETPIVKNILDVSRGRKLFRMTLEYISRIAHTGLFTGVQKRLETAENKWLFIMSLFIKAYHAGNFENATRMKIYRNIKDVVDDEKNIYGFFNKNQP
ncbi:MAG: hypothetical protein JXB88_00840 [Spirochaetales bacterium]|nr:hypothetical protein [Spirochaetales bacterium]